LQIVSRSPAQLENRHQLPTSRSRANKRVQIAARRTPEATKDGSKSRPKVRRLHVRSSRLCFIKRRAGVKSFVHAEQSSSNHLWWLSKSSLAALMTLCDRETCLWARATSPSTWSSKVDTNSLPLAQRVRRKVQGLNTNEFMSVEQPRKR